MEKMTVERSIWINATRERVWNAITDAEQIMKWWGADHWEIEKLEVGAGVKFGDAEDQLLATIVVLDPPQKFSIRWPPQEAYHNIEVFTTYELTEENGGTTIKVSETGFEALPEDVRQKRFDQTAKGYETVLAGLKNYVEGPAQGEA
jgi:uncharacterized protein YndB with AHSA1/START domain